MNSVEHLQAIHRDMTLIHQNFLWQMGRNAITNELLVSYTSSVFTYMSSYEQVLQQVHQEILRKETVICELQRETRGLREKSSNASSNTSSASTKEISKRNQCQRTKKWAFWSHCYRAWLAACKYRALLQSMLYRSHALESIVML